MQCKARLAAVIAVLASTPVMAMNGAEVDDHLKRRFEADRTGVCVVAAVVDGGQVTRGRYCARGGQPPGDDDAFEIGSVTKTMTAFLVAELVEAGRWSLDDPIARHLPEGTVVPRFQQHDILVRHLLTHTSGLPPLPPAMPVPDPANPYGALTEAALLKSLADTALTQAPGGAPAYSNFAMMVLSLAVARAHGNDLEAALRNRLFTPLGMRSAAIRRPAGARWVDAHAPNGAVVPGWTITPNLAGVGMVRASLNDMVQYLQAQLGQGPAPVVAAMRRTRQPLAAGFGMNWVLAPVQGRTLALHEGGTGGFSALVAMDEAAGKGVVMLADTALTDLGGLGDAALPLITSMPLGQPRVARPTPERWLKALPGDYLLQAANLPITLRADGGQLKARAAGQGEETLGYDSRGDFYPLGASYLLRPLADLADAGPVNRLVLRQGGGAMELHRVGAQDRPTANNPAWKELAGDYQLTPQFSLRVFEDNGVLKVQGTGQGALAGEWTAPDRLEIKPVGAVIEFTRNSAQEVTGLVLVQAGQRLPGIKK